VIYIHTVEEHGAAKKPWVAHIVGRASRYGLAREFLRPMRDWKHATKRMSGRVDGIRDSFILETGWVCEFCTYAPNWCGRKKQESERFFAEVREDGLHRMTLEEVLAWLQTSSDT
jgi:hypothetical protein